MILGDYQSTNSAGFIFGCIVAPLLVIGGIVWLCMKGKDGNDVFKYSPGSRHPILVLIWRFIILIYCLTALSYTFVPNDSDEASVWALGYFTIWSWLLVNFYFVISTGVSIIRTFYSHLVPKPGDDEESRSKPVVVLFSLQQIIGEIEVPSSLFVTLVVWAYLAPTSTPAWTPFLTYTSISQHLLNCMIMFADFLVSGYMFNGTHWALALIWPALYAIWHLIGNAAYGIMAYPFMATDDPAYIGWLIGLALVSVLFFFMYYGISKLKCKCFKQRYLLEIEEEEGNLDEEKDLPPKEEQNHPEQDHEQLPATIV